MKSGGRYGFNGNGVSSLRNYLAAQFTDRTPSWGKEREGYGLLVTGLIIIVIVLRVRRII